MTCFDDLKCFIEFVAGHAIMIETLHHFLHIAVANTQFGSKGIPFFRSQSLDRPLPRTEEELTECLDEMIKRIRVRACRLSGIPD